MTGSRLAFLLLIVLAGTTISGAAAASSARDRVVAPTRAAPPWQSPPLVTGGVDANSGALPVGLAALPLLAAGQPRRGMSVAVPTVAVFGTVAWSPTRPLIAFGASIGGRQGIAVARLDGSQLRLLTPSPDPDSRVGESSVDPVWSPGGGRLAFWSASASDSTGFVRVIGADGHGLRTVAVGQWPAWAPDGQRLVFETFDPTASPAGVEVADLRTGALRRLGPWATSAPEWAPSGTVVTLAAVPGAPGCSVFLVRSDGGGRRRLTAGDAPVWSSSGRLLAYDRGGSVYVIRPDGTGKRQLGGVPASDQKAFAPGRDLLAVLRGYGPRARRGGFVVDVSTGRVRRVLGPDAATQAFGPSWSPDGGSLAFVTRSHRIYVVHADGSGGRFLDLRPSGAASTVLRKTDSRVGLFGSGRHTRLVGLNARTLEPLRGPSPLPLGAAVESAALSPDRTRAALSFGRSVVVVRTSNLRVVSRTKGEVDASRGLLFLGGGLLIAHGWSGYGHEYAVVGTSGAVDTDADVVAALPEGAVLMDGPQGLDLYRGADVEVSLPQMPAAAPFAVAADVAGDRLFVVSASGLVAEVDHPARHASITYHPVALSGHPFQAGWAGSGRIALWGQDGLGLIDTAGWSTHAVAPDVTDVVPTPYGLIAWNRNGVGLALYRPNGSLRFRLLAGHSVSSVESIGAFAYVRAGGRFSVDLRNGRVTGPLASRARLVLPTLAPIP